MLMPRVWLASVLRLRVYWCQQWRLQLQWHTRLVGLRPSSRSPIATLQKYLHQLLDLAATRVFFLELHP
jgi:hypothetical protein